MAARSVLPGSIQQELWRAQTVLRESIPLRLAQVVAATARSVKALGHALVAAIPALLVSIPSEALFAWTAQQVKDHLLVRAAVLCV